jgi:hypothetical protein
MKHVWRTSEIRLNQVYRLEHRANKEKWRQKNREKKREQKTE